MVFLAHLLAAPFERATHAGTIPPLAEVANLYNITTILRIGQIREPD
jgi:hypothetical protein